MNKNIFKLIGIICISNTISFCESLSDAVVGSWVECPPLPLLKLVQKIGAVQGRMFHEPSLTADKLLDPILDG